MSSQDLAEGLAVSPSALQRVLEGVGAATFANLVEIRPIHERIALCGAALSLPEWYALLCSTDAYNAVCQQYAGLAVGVALLRECYLRQQTASAASLNSVWNLVNRAFTTEAPLMKRFQTFPRMQGFLAVPLCILREHERIVEEYFLHIWLPDERRSTSSMNVFSDPYHAQHWVLAGEAVQHAYELQPVVEPEEANYREGTFYLTALNTHSTYSLIRNGEQLFRTQEDHSKVYKHGAGYSVPPSSFYNSEVAPDIVYATICCLDSSREANYKIPVLIACADSLPIQQRIVHHKAAGELGRIVGSVRELELLMQQADHYAQHAEWESSMKALDSALHLCDACLDLPTLHRYRDLVIDWLGFTNRCLGRYQEALDLMEPILMEMGPTAQRVGICGELGVVYRHMERFEDAKRVLEDQYNTAKQLRLAPAICRAIGNLGVVNYQLSMLNKDSALLNTAVDQLNERVTRARNLQKSRNTGATSENHDTGSQYANTLEAIGLARLSLCHTARDEGKKAVAAALESLKVTSVVQDSAVVALSRLFYGRALLFDGQYATALEQFNLHDGCTCAIALCKEPSQENHQFLQELADVGAKFDLADAEGYTALDYAVFNNSKVAEDIALSALSKCLGDNAEHRLKQLAREARLRKGYREIFQDKMRPILLSNSGSRIHEVRQAYLHALDTDAEKCSRFDRLKYVPYEDFVILGRFPRSGDSLTRYFSSSSTDVDYIIFFSYRWLNSDPWASTPDDIQNTQYLRTVIAIDDFLKAHPDVNTETLGIWIDYACIDQEDPMSGIAALPMIIAQCNALISLVDANYYNRAWCSVEVMMIQALRRTYNLHSWFEHVANTEASKSGGNYNWTLKKESSDFDIDLTTKQLRFEHDWSKVKFLERQCKLLC